MLLEKSENSSLARERVCALYDGGDVEEIRGVLTKIYKLRNKLLHGQQDILSTLGGSEFFPRQQEVFALDGQGKVSPEGRWLQLLGHEEANISLSLALKLIQRFIELDRTRITFRLGVVN
jgi:hypothetical protein